MALPPAKQRIWQSLRIARRLTLNELCIITECSRGTIAKHLRGWIWLGLAKTEPEHRTGKGQPRLIYSLTDPNIVDPPND